MDALRSRARQLLESGTVGVVLGYALGTAGRRRPLFACTAEEAEALVFDEACRLNLAGYVARRDLRRLGRMALVARPAALRSLVQLAAERQVADADVLALAVADGAVLELDTIAAMEAYLSSLADQPASDVRAELARLRALPAEERWAYWQSELSRCLKCYACRGVCPMCYCERCTVECNRPQWVPVASHGLGNVEYHLMRAMHLAGRCVECGSCGEACPVGIPVHLLTIAAEESVREQFGQRGGAGAAAGYALSSFRPDDQEGFIR